MPQATPIGTAMASERKVTKKEPDDKRQNAVFRRICRGFPIQAEEEIENVHFLKKRRAALKK